MDTINWLHIRGLALLALVGFFVMYAVLVASLQKWRVGRVPRVPRLDTPVEVESFAHGGISTVADPRDHREAASVANVMRRAA